MIPLAKGRQLLNPAHSGNFHIISRIHLVLTFFWWIQSHLFMWNQLRDLNLLRQFPALHPQVQACLSYCEVQVILKKKQLSYKHKDLNYTLIIKPSYTFSLQPLGGQPHISAVHFASERGGGSRITPKPGQQEHVCVPAPCQNTHSCAWICSGLVEWRKGEVCSRGHPRKGSPDYLPRASKIPLLTEEFLGKDLISPHFRHVPKIDIDSKADDSSFRNARTSSLQSLHKKLRSDIQNRRKQIPPLVRMYKQHWCLVREQGAWIPAHLWSQKLPD